MKEKRCRFAAFCEGKHETFVRGVSPVSSYRVGFTFAIVHNYTRGIIVRGLKGWFGMMVTLSLTLLCAAISVAYEGVPAEKVEEVKKFTLKAGEPSKVLVEEVELKEGEKLVFLPGFEGRGLCAARFRFSELKLHLLPDGPEYQPPREWKGKEVNSTEGNPYLVDGKPMWQFVRIWPDDPKKPENYKLMAWIAFGGLQRWGVPEGEQGVHGGQPDAYVTYPEGVVTIEIRTPWPGRPGYKLGALVFIAPKSGKYQVKTTVTTKVWEGGGPSLILRLLKIVKFLQQNFVGGD